MPKSFLDTNVLVYASDHDEPDKRRIARELLRRSAQEGSGVISTQVVQEFFVSATRKLSIEPMRADSLILAVAGRASCSMVYSEDLNPGQFYSGVEVRNPFAAG